MDWILCPRNSYIDALTPNVSLFGDKAFKELIKVKWGYKGETQIPYNKRDTGVWVHNRKTFWRHNMIEAIYKPRGEALRETNLAGTSIVISSLQNYERVNFSCFSHLVSGILFWQP